ncbi:hypothetical protein ACLKA6_010149 [Drosophila palustris]
MEGHLKEGGRRRSPLGTWHRRDGQEQHSGRFRFGKIPVIGLKRVAERDGMRAAPAPSGATAPARENPPPTGINPETSPAMSGSSVCPAGPSDSLEDLAEDEDLADLTLDPAAVEEMDEQMAMSS